MPATLSQRKIAPGEWLHALLIGAIPLLVLLHAHRDSQALAVLYQPAKAGPMPDKASFVGTPPYHPPQNKRDKANITQATIPACHDRHSETTGIRITYMSRQRHLLTRPPRISWYWRTVAKLRGSASGSPPYTWTMPGTLQDRVAA